MNIDRDALISQDPFTDPDRKLTGGKDKICCGDLRVILNYLIAEQNKKASGLKIGICTVFMVVAIITMLESVVSVTPILFVKLGQEEAGAIDFKLTYKSSNLVSGDVNFYAVDPFALNYTSGFGYGPLPA